MSVPSNNIRQDPESSPPASGFLIAIVVLFSLSYLTFSLWLLIDLWARDKSFITHVLSIKKENLDVTFLMALYTTVGALVGSGTLDLVSYHKYVGVNRNFQRSHIPGYFFGPWLAGTVGLIVFCLLQSGLFIFSGSQNVAVQETTVSKMAYISVGFLSGFGWMSAIEKIREIVTRFFAKDLRTPNRLKGPRGTDSPNELPPLAPPDNSRDL